jgi:hypothetical protein
MGSNEMSKHDHILAGLVFSLQAAAMQQLGKIQNPMTGEIEKDLDQAKSTIDILDMLKTKCRSETPGELLRMIDGAVMDLQLNYMDEVKKSASQETDSDAGDEAAEDAAEEAAAEAPAEAAAEAAPDIPQDDAGEKADG